MQIMNMQMSSILLGMGTSLVILCMSLIVLMTCSKSFNNTIKEWNNTKQTVFCSQLAMMGVLLGFVLAGIFYS